MLFQPGFMNVFCFYACNFKEEEMASLRSFRGRFLVCLALVSLLILSACGTTGNSGGTTSGSTGSTSTTKGPITVASKLDTENQLIAKMYTLLLQKAGFKVNEKPALGNNTFIFQAI